MKTEKTPEGLKAIPKEITFAEYEAVREAINNNDFPAFQKASIDIYFKISAIHHDAYLKFVGADEKEPEPKKPEKDLITGISWPCYPSAFLAIHEYEVGEIVQWDGTDGDGTKLADPQVVEIIQKKRDGLDYEIKYPGYCYFCNSSALSPIPNKKKAEHEYAVGEIVHWDGTDGYRGGKLGDKQLIKIIKISTRYGYKIKYLDKTTTKWCYPPSLRPLTEDELAEYHTVELDGERYVANKEGKKPIKRHIKVRIFENPQSIRAQISEQTHRGFDFSPSIDGKDDSFKASNGYSLSSFLYPAHTGGDFFFVRGSEHIKDGKLIELPNKEILKQFLTAINEYNEYWATKDVCPPTTFPTKCYEVG